MSLTISASNQGENILLTFNTGKELLVKQVTPEQGRGVAILLNGRIQQIYYASTAWEQKGLTDAEESVVSGYLTNRPFVERLMRRGLSEAYAKAAVDKINTHYSRYVKQAQEMRQSLLIKGSDNPEHRDVSIEVATDGLVHTPLHFHNPDGEKIVLFESEMTRLRETPVLFGETGVQKKLPPNQRSEENMQLLMQEDKHYALMQKTHNVVRRIGAVGSTRWPQLEEMDSGDLIDMTERGIYQTFSVALKKSILLQICNGIREIHSLGYTHQDIKPDNILFKRTSDQENPYLAKIGDLGLLKLIGEQGAACGTPYYCSGNKFLSDKSDSKDDIYAFGITCYSLYKVKRLSPELSEAMPSTREESDAYDKERTKFLERVFGKQIDNPRTIESVIYRSMVPDPNKRPTSDELYRQIEALALEEFDKL